MERGQVLERMTLVRSGEDELEALYQSGGVRGQGMPVVLAPSHPRWGGTMDAAACGEIVWCLARRGHPTLRFNWRGVGASRGASRVPWPESGPPASAHPTSGALADGAADLEAAISQHAGGAPCAVIGIGFGAAVAARVAARHPLVERAVLVAPPVAALPFDFEALAAAGVIVTLFAGAEDTLAPPAALAAAAGGGFGVQVIAGAGHGFSRGLSELGRRVAASLPGAGAGDDDLPEDC
jgi:uncharacterized protein